MHHPHSSSIVFAEYQIFHWQNIQHIAPSVPLFFFTSIPLYPDVSHVRVNMCMKWPCYTSRYHRVVDFGSSWISTVRVIHVSSNIANSAALFCTRSLQFKILVMLFVHVLCRFECQYTFCWISCLSANTTNNNDFQSIRHSQRHLFVSDHEHWNHKRHWDLLLRHTTFWSVNTCNKCRPASMQ